MYSIYLTREISSKSFRKVSPNLGTILAQHGNVIVKMCKLVTYRFLLLDFLPYRDAKPGDS